MKSKDIEDIYELSPLQLGLFYHSLKAPEEGLYFEQVTIPFQGPVDSPALKAAWKQVTADHPILRTSFHWEDLKNPMQVVHRSVDLPFHEKDWSHIPRERREAELNAFLMADREAGFTMDLAPLSRITLIHFSADSHTMVWSFHHVLLDGWSSLAVLKKLTRHYLQAMQGERLTPERVRPFAEYIQWLRQQDPARAAEFWKRRLGGFTEPTPLGIDTNLSPQAGFGAVKRQLSRDLTLSLEELGRQRKLTVNTIFQGAWALLLNRYSRKENLLYGTVVSGRPPGIEGVEDMVGLFINTLPVSVQISPDKPIADWLSELQMNLAEMRDYEYGQLAEIQGHSGIPQGTPLFHSLVAYENYAGQESGQESSDNGAKADFIERTNYPLTLIGIPGRQLEVKILFQGHLFAEETVERIIDHLTLVFEQMVSRPDLPLKEISLLRSDARERVVRQWNDTRTDYPRDSSIPELFEKVARQFAGKPALKMGSRDVSYRKLNEQANRIAHFLLEQGVRPESPVGLLMKPSPECLTVMLGILKAGAAYVPLDPQYPERRLAFLIEDARLPLVIADSGLEVKVAALGTRTVTFDREEWINMPAEDPGRTIGPTSLAYMIYTSGTTGLPKGTCVSHRNVVRLVHNTNYLDFSPGLNWLQLASMSFDASTLEIWGSLLHGSTLVLYPAEELTLDDLARTLVEEEISALWLTAGLFHKMVDEQLNALAGLKVLLAGGDVLSPAHVGKLRRAMRGGRLLNGYGPTENTTFTTVHEISVGEDLSAGVPIGKPISNTTVYVLDPYGDPQPPGVPGELFAGGDGVALGYHERPELSRKRFVTDPFSKDTTARLYAIGDLGMYREDGTLMFCGREDRQVKIRGFRVELGEIETCLAAHPELVQVTAALHETASSDRCIVVYYTTNPKAGPGADELREYVVERLPGYLVPSFFIRLDEIPLTANGKIDRRALPVPGVEAQQEEEFSEGQRGEIESVLADIWKEVLHLDVIGLHKDFFNDYGGHSLLATQLVSRVRSHFEIDLSLRDFFAAPNVTALAAVVEEILLAEIEDLEGGPDRETVTVNP